MNSCIKYEPETMQAAAENLAVCQDALDQIVQYAQRHCSLDGAFGLLLQPLQPIHNGARDAVMDNLRTLGDTLGVTAQSVRDAMAEMACCEEAIRACCDRITSDITTCGEHAPDDVPGNTGVPTPGGGNPGGGSPGGGSPGGGSPGGGSPGGGSPGGGSPGGGMTPPPPVPTPDPPKPEVPEDTDEDEKDDDCDSKVDDDRDRDCGDDGDEDRDHEDDDKERPEGHPEGCRCEACDTPHPVDCRCGTCDAHPVGCRCEACDTHPVGCRCDACLTSGLQPGCPPGCTACGTGKPHMPTLLVTCARPDGVTDERELEDLAEQWERREPIRIVRETCGIGFEADAGSAPASGVSFDINAVITAAYRGEAPSSFDRMGASA